MKNISDGILNWKITGIPDWLLISRSSGSLNYGSSIDITASLDPVSIPQGQDLSAILQILSNSTTGSYSLPVHVPAEAIVPAEVRQITGIVTDAEYNYETALMAICTKSPNSLIVFNSNTNESTTIALANTPNCVSLSEDGHKAVVGYSVPAISYINIDNKEITRDYTIDCIPFDLVFGDNEWCYITPTEDQWVRFRNLNLNSGELIPGKTAFPLFEGSVIRKIPGKPFLVGSRLSLSPTGLLIYDVTSGIANDTVSYYHESIGNFLISKDGLKLYSGYGNVYVLPAYDTDYHTSPLPVSGQIRPEFQNITAMDECPALNSIFVTSSIFHFQPGYSTLIEQFNSTNLSKIKSFNTSPVSVTENGIKTSYETSARFIFVNKEGSRMYTIKNLKQNYNKDFWTVETFHLK